MCQIFLGRSVVYQHTHTSIRRRFMGTRFQTV